MNQCLTCKNKIISNPKSHSSRERIYCSYKCYWKTLEGKPTFNKGKSAPWAKNLPQQFKKGQKAPLTAFKKGQKPWNKGKEWIEMKGKNHPNWKGGISEKVRKFNREKSKRWAYKIYKRDNWRCRNCSKKERNLHAHHLKSWRDYPKSRFKIDNGITLCQECHKKVHYKGLTLPIHVIYTIHNQ